MGHVIRSFLERISRTAPERTSGRPPSGNGASSFHLFWDVPPVPLHEVRATIEVIEPPRVDMLYFWALQVDVSDRGNRRGGAHFGLQYHPSYPGAGAVNWGGYHRGGGELSGSTSDLPSTLDNVNTRDYRWESGRAYRYRVYPSPEQGWRGSITDLTTGVETVVRDLHLEGDELTRPMVWTECFAHCEHPAAAVRWSDLGARTADGEWFEVTDVRINYQSHADGGCSNTNSSIEAIDGGQGFVQRTGTPRQADTGARLTLHPAG